MAKQTVISIQWNILLSYTKELTTDRGNQTMHCAKWGMKIQNASVEFHLYGIHGHSGKGSFQKRKHMGSWTRTSIRKRSYYKETREFEVIGWGGKRNILDLHSGGSTWLYLVVKTQRAICYSG